MSMEQDIDRAGRGEVYRLARAENHTAPGKRKRESSTESTCRGHEAQEIRQDTALAMPCCCKGQRGCVPYLHADGGRQAAKCDLRVEVPHHRGRPRGRQGQPVAGRRLDADHLQRLRA